MPSARCIHADFRSDHTHSIDQSARPRGGGVGLPLLRRDGIVRHKPDRNPAAINLCSIPFIQSATTTWHQGTIGTKAGDFSKRRGRYSWQGVTEANLPDGFDLVSKAIRSGRLSWD
jgi:hypothetical protein